MPEEQFKMEYSIEIVLKNDIDFEKYYVIL